MFYAHFVLSKKGPLARIWLAAHWDKKLTRAHVFETNITSSVEAILEPKLKMALRTSGHLLLGVVRIYSRKTKYLLADCNEAFVKIKMAFRPGVINLDEETNRENAINAITLPAENIHEFEATIADLDDLNMNTRAINQSRPEDITMREDFGEINLGRQDDDFGDSTFDESASRELIRDASESRSGLYNRMGSHDRISIREEIHGGDDFGADSTLLGDDFLEKSGHPDKRGSSRGVDLGGAAMNIDDDLDDNFGGGFLDHDNDDDESFVGDMDQSIFAGENLFEDPSARTQLEKITSAIESHMDTTKLPPLISETPIPSRMGQSSNIFNNTPMYGGNDTENLLADHQLLESRVSIKQDQNVSQMVQSAIVANETGAFPLQPIEASTLHSMEPRRNKRKRRLIIDEQRAIPSEVMKIQMHDTSDITSELNLAPPTKKLMYWKENGSVEKLFQLPGHALHCRILQRIFLRNLRTIAVTDENLDPKINTQNATKSNVIEASINRSFDHVLQPIQEESEPSISESNLPLKSPRITEDPFLAAVGDNVRQVSTYQHDPSLVQMEHHSDAESDFGADLGPLNDDFEPSSGTHRPPYEGGQLTHLGQTPAYNLPSVSHFDNFTDDVLALEQELAACDREAEAEKVAALTNASELSANAHVVAGSALESAEERRLEKRSKVMLRILRKRFAQMDDDQNAAFTFQSLCPSQISTKKQVASKFYTMLLLRKQGVVELGQREPFSDILISRSHSFNFVECH